MGEFCVTGELKGYKYVCVRARLSVSVRMYVYMCKHEKQMYMRVCYVCMYMYAYVRICTLINKVICGTCENSPPVSTKLSFVTVKDGSIVGTAIGNRSTGIEAFLSCFDVKEEKQIS